MWVTNYNEGTLTRVDGDTNSPGEPIEIGRNPCGIAAYDGRLWVGVLGDNALAIFDPETNEVEQTIALGGAPWDVQPGHGSVWVAVQRANEVVRLEPNGSVSARIPVGEMPIGLAVTDNEVWVASRTDQQIVRIDPLTAEVTGTVDFDVAPYWFAVAPDTVLITFSDDRSAALLDKATAAVLTTIEVGIQPRDPGFVSGAFWVANQGSGDVHVLSADDGSRLGEFEVSGGIGIWTAEGLLGDGWVESFGGSRVTRFAADAGLP